MTSLKISFRDKRDVAEAFFLSLRCQRMKLIKPEHKNKKERGKPDLTSINKCSPLDLELPSPRLYYIASCYMWREKIATAAIIERSTTRQSTKVSEGK
jgi:hypothetical protein